MTDLQNIKMGDKNSEIVIEEEEISDCSDAQDSIQEVIPTQHHNNLFKRGEQIKINRQKLLKYAALGQKNTNKDQQSKIQRQQKTEEQAILMKTTHFDRSPSHPILKPVKHKVTTNNNRTKANANKQNNCSPLFPRMNLKRDESKQILNKTTSALSFKTGKEQGSCMELKETTFSSKQPHNQSRVSGKSSNGKMKIQAGQSRQIMNRTFNKTSSLSKFRYLNPLQSNNHEISVDHAGVMNALTNINEKQEQLIEQKKQLQDRVKELKGYIEKQHSFLQESVRNRQKIATSMSRQEYQSRHSLDGAKINKRKLETCQTEAKNMEGKIIEISECNTKIAQAIDEEKQLIGMYESVIEELRGQLKQEKEKRSDLQKKLAVLKKNLKNVEAKSNNQNNSTRELFQKVFTSLDRWN